MTPRRALAGVLVGLTLALAACGGQSDPDTVPTITVPPSTPDGVAGAFAAAYAAGDTPRACTFAAGRAAQQMADKGMCAHTQWPAVQYWPGRVCVFGSDDPYLSADLTGLHLFQFHTSGSVDGFPDFLVGVQPAGPTWRVTSVLPDTPSTGGMYLECKRADMSNTTAEPSS